MSATWDIVCRDCKERLWIGQGRPDNKYVYSGDPVVMKILGEFLERHAEHSLAFVSEFDTESQDGWKEFDEIANREALADKKLNMMEREINLHIQFPSEDKRYKIADIMAPCLIAEIRRLRAEIADAHRGID